MTLPPETQRAVERLVAAIDMADRYEIGGTSFGDGPNAATLDHADVLKVIVTLSELQAREAVLKAKGTALVNALCRYGFPVSGGARAALSDHGSNEAVDVDNAAREFRTALTPTQEQSQ